MDVFEGLFAGASFRQNGIWKPQPKRVWSGFWIAITDRQKLEVELWGGTDIAERRRQGHHRLVELYRAQNGSAGKNIPHLPVRDALTLLVHQS